MAKLFVLEIFDIKTIEEQYENFGSWSDIRGYVLRAENEQDARALALEDYGRVGGQFWLDAGVTSCKLIETDGPREIILANQPTG